MGNRKEIVKKVVSKIEAIQKINDEPKKSSKNSFDEKLNNIPSTNEFVGEKLGAYQDKRKKKKDNKENIFKDLIKVTDAFLGKDDKEVDNEPVEKNKEKKTPKNNIISKNKSRVMKHALDSVDITMDSAKKILIKNLSQALYMGDNLCGAESILSIDQLTISPEEFDFLDMLTLDPESGCGKLVYEPLNPDRNKVKINREIYKTFDGTTTFTMDSNNGNSLFELSWLESSQQFNVNGLTQNGAIIKVQDFISDYFISMELPEAKDIAKTAIMLTIHGGCEGESKFNITLNENLRFIDKLLTICGSPNSDELSQQNAIDLMNETDEDVEFYFNFNDVEGIDLDDDDARYRRVLRFQDCYNFEIPMDESHLEDFIYLSNTKPITEAIEDILGKVATDASEQDGSGIPLSDFINNLLNNLLINIPKALVLSILSAKVFLPFVILYKSFKASSINVIENIKELMKKFWQAIKKTISELFWLFMRTFWDKIKKDLKNFVQKLVTSIIKKKYKRYLLIVTSLIALLRKLAETEIDNCLELYQVILDTITKAINAKTPINVPSVLLVLSEALPGYSTDRAYLNILEKLEAAGVPTGPIYGESNDVTSLVKSIIEGHTEEEDANSFVKIVLYGGTLPGPPIAGGAIIPPGVISGVGKKF